MLGQTKIQQIDIEDIAAPGEAHHFAPGETSSKDHVGGFCVKRDLGDWAIESLIKKNWLVIDCKLFQVFKCRSLPSGKLT